MRRSYVFFSEFRNLCFTLWVVLWRWRSNTREKKCNSWCGWKNCLYFELLFFAKSFENYFSRKGGSAVCWEILLWAVGTRMWENSWAVVFVRMSRLYVSGCVLCVFNDVFLVKYQFSLAIWSCNAEYVEWKARQKNVWCGTASCGNSNERMPAHLCKC